MTTPPRPAPEPLSWLPATETPSWCSSCGVHQATVARPLCPICLDDKARERK